MNYTLLRTLPDSWSIGTRYGSHHQHFRLQRGFYVEACRGNRLDFVGGHTHYPEEIAASATGHRQTERLRNINPIRLVDQMGLML